MLALFLLFTVPAVSEESLYQNHFKPTLNDGFDKTGLWILAGGITATLIARNYDYQMRDAWIDHQRMNSSTSRVGDILGSGVPGAVIAATQLLWLDFNGGMAHAEALVDTALTTYAIKYSSGRARPSSDDHLSFPSGHTSTTFASATSLTYSYGWYAALPSYALAVLTAASRWSDDAHWFSDTVAGALIGYFWGRATALHHIGNSNAQLVPFADTKSAGLFLRSEF